jgi:hypothetical protein
MQIRRFSPDLKIKIPGNHPGLYGVPIQFRRAQIPPEKREAFARCVNGMPLLLDAELQVEVMYFDPHASMQVLFLQKKRRTCMMRRMGRPTEGRSRNSRV